MSAGGSMRFSGYFDFYFNSIQTGGDVTQNLRDVTVNIDTFNAATKAATATSGQYGTSIRRLALDFRLIATSINRVVTTMGLQDTIVGKAADTITIFGNSIAAVVLTMGAWTRINTEFSGVILGASMKAASLYQGALAALGLTTATLIPIILLLVAGVVAINYVWNETSGINSYRESLKTLEEEVESLESSLKSLRLEQSQLGVQSSALAKEQAILDEKFATGAMGAEEYAQKSELISANQAILAATTATVTHATNYYSNSNDQTKASIEGVEQALTDAQQAKNEFLVGMVGGLSQLSDPLGISRGGMGDYFRSLLGFASGGIVSSTGPVMAHAGEQIIPAGENGGGAMNLTISMEGANIYGREGVEEALEVGGNKLRKQLEYMRRPRARW